ncbi:RhoGAP-domain-containing protein [Peniophora sp. CONT]|nr:RhoGAP-domain-containing protein [Peniophora sp. CONT]
MSSSPRQTSPIALTPAPASSLPPQQPPPQLSRPPARASTTGSQNDDPRPRVTVPTSARSEDLHSHSHTYNHEYGPGGGGGGGGQQGLGSGQREGGSAGRQRLLSASRPSTPTSGSEHRHGSSAGEHDGPGSANSDRDRPPVPAPASVASSSSTVCSACGQVMTGAFVRALNTVFHLGCFKCMDCGDVVAQKFFPIDTPNGQQPLCERDYFRRLNLICASCGSALRGSYITACNKKYHVEHFTCSICPTLFGPQDSYYEHEGDVFCHYHYSTRWATKCAGCDTAILKQFVEIQRNMRDECWHPECYMINKFWNVKIVSRRPQSLDPPPVEGQEQPWAEEEARENPASLKEKQVRMEQQVYRIWTVLSAFEESSAACISDMLRQVSNGQYLEAIRMAEKFILHVEVLFATLDDLEFAFARLNLKSPSHVREARLLCRKTVDLFTLLSHTQETGARRMGMTQELLALVTGLAHYLKILIRIALTGALKLEREHGQRDAMSSFLDKLHLLAVQGGNPGARRIMGRGGQRERGAITASSDTLAIEPVQQQPGVNAGTAGVTYGFRSLAPESAGESPFGGAPRDPALANVPVVNPPSDLCVKCGLTVEEDCVRLGTYQRWHSACIACKMCGKAAAAAPPAPAPPASANPDDPPKMSSSRRPPANAHLFVYDPESQPMNIFCTEHGDQRFRQGFVPVSRLEQYAFLLNVALRRLYLLLKKRRVITGQPSPAPAPPPAVQDDPYRNSAETMRMKTAHLDRKLSATARLPKRSTVVESPSGRMAQPTDVVTSTRGASSHAQATAQSAQQYGQAQQYAQPQQSQVALQHAPSHPGAGQSAEMHARSQAQTHMHTPQQAHHPQLVQTQNLPSQQQQQLQQQQKRTPPGDRPALSRKNTDVMIVDDPMPAPASPAEIAPSNGGLPLPLQPVVAREGITLADIPQLAEAAQALEQHRALPRQRATPFIAELAPLQLAIVKHAAVVILYRSALRDSFELDELLEMVEVRKGGFWGKLFKGSGGGAKGKAKKGGVFGVPLELLVEKEGADSLHGATRETLRVPSFIDDVVSAMRQMDMSVEGIFRKNGNIKRLNDIVEVYDRDPASVDLTSDNPVQLAALLKRFLRELPDPLLTFRLHKLLILSQNAQTIPNEAERRRLMHMLMLVLPKAHRDTLEVLFVFLKWVASFAHLDERTGSKMDLPNLATVICPSILYSQGRDAVRDDSFGAIRVIQALLENQDEYYTVPEEFAGLLGDQAYFAGCMEMPGKEFMKKVETYMRLKASGRQLGTMSPIVGGPPYAGGHPGRQGEPLDVNRLGAALSRSPERPGLVGAASESYMRGGAPTSANGSSSQYPSPVSRTPALPHQPMSFPPPGQTSLGQGGAMMNQALPNPHPHPNQMQAPQPRPANGYQSDGEWHGPRAPALQPPSRPSSRERPSRSSGEMSRSPAPGTPLGYGNGHGNGYAPTNANAEGRW